jgi:hypothetical protein
MWLALVALLGAYAPLIIALQVIRVRTHPPCDKVVVLEEEHIHYLIQF